MNQPLSTIADVPLVSCWGARIPKIGLGTWELRGDTCADIVSAALQMGYTHLDTAQGYQNEEAVGRGLAQSGVGRDKVFVTTKIMPGNMADGDLQRSVEESLVRLGTGHIDLLLLHWPNPAIDLAETVRALNATKRAGLTRHIGLSNFTSTMLDKAWHLTEEPLAAAQIEYHPYLDQRIMLAALRKHNMGIIAYCPIALGKVLQDPVIAETGARHRLSAAQATLRWLVQQDGVIAIPRTSKVVRLAENLDVFDFELSPAEMDRMGKLTRPGSRLINEPQWVPEWD